MTFKNILVPLDGSSLAEAALPFARALALRAGASLTLVRTAHYSSLLADVAADQLDAVESAETYLERLGADLRVAGFDVVSAVPFGGSTADWIVEESDYRDADMIIMATHDRVGADRLLHGSVAEAVVHRSTTPVMLVRATDAEPLSARVGTSKPVVIVALDGSALAEEAVPVARNLSSAIDGRLVVVGVIPKPGQLVAGKGGAVLTYSGSQHAELEAEAKAYLTEIKERLGPDAQAVIQFGDAATEIAATAEARGAAAVVMGTHGRSGLVRSLLGSVAGQVLHRTSIPLVLVRTGGGRGAEEPAPVAMSAAPAE